MTVFDLSSFFKKVLLLFPEEALFFFLGKPVSLFLNAPCHGGQGAKKAKDGLPEKTERQALEKGNEGFFTNIVTNTACC